MLCVQAVEVSKNLAAEEMKPAPERAVPRTDRMNEDAGITTLMRSLKKNVLDTYEQGGFPLFLTQSTILVPSKGP